MGSGFSPTPLSVAAKLAEMRGGPLAIVHHAGWHVEIGPDFDEIGKTAQFQLWYNDRNTIKFKNSALRKLK